jgi:hypothetical protein
MVWSVDYLNELIVRPGNLRKAGTMFLSHAVQLIGAWARASCVILITCSKIVNTKIFLLHVFSTSRVSFNIVLAKNRGFRPSSVYHPCVLKLSKSRNLQIFWQTFFAFFFFEQKCGLQNGPSHGRLYAKISLSQILTNFLHAWVCENAGFWIWVCKI